MKNLTFKKSKIKIVLFLRLLLGKLRPQSLGTLDSFIRCFLTW